MSFQTVCDMFDFWPGEMQGAVVDGVGVLLVNVDNSVHAYLDQCPHKRIPLSQGRLEGTTLTCGAHGWQFDVTTGEGLNPASARLVDVPICISGHNLQVDVSGLTPGRSHDD